MVISKVDKKDKTLVVELTVGSDDFTSIFKEIKESLQQLILKMYSNLSTKKVIKQ